MIIFLLLATAYSWLGTGATPISAGPLTNPTIIHSIVFGVHARSGCSNMRTMYDILRSCFFTIAACVYRAVHPNIPYPEYGFWRRLGITINITLWALMAPELMIYWALCQWFGAKRVAKAINDAIERRKPNAGFKWTLTHGQFMQMGGFAEKDNKVGIHWKRLVDEIDNGFVDIEDLRLTEKEINDKSKGDALSKGLVAFQTSWFMFECITRLRQGLPLLEIEVVTLAFATLNVITYGLWWYKPLNVLCPICIPIQSQRLGPAPSPTAPTVTQTTVAPTHQQRVMTAVVWGVIKAMVTGVWGVVKAMAAAVGSTVKGVFKLIKEEVRFFGWQLLVKWLHRLFIALPFKIFRLVADELFDLFYLKGHFSAESSEEDEVLIQAVSAFIGMIFGAVHFLSWNAAFPTHHAQLLWRAASIILVVQPFLVLLTALLDVPGEWLWQRSPRTCMQRHRIFIHAILMFLSLFIGPFPYIFARFCILVLAFLTLHHLPSGALADISWTAYIPHI